MQEPRSIDAGRGVSGKPLSRRQFLRAALAVSGGIAGLAAVQQAAAVRLDGAPVALRGARPAAQTPVMGGKVIATSKNDMTTLDPKDAVDYESWALAKAVFNGLYNIDRNSQIYPELAAAMPEISSDGTVYSIPLRQGVKFHNGRELTADDVVYTINRTANPKNNSWGQSYLGGILSYDDVTAGKAETLAGVTATGPYAVQITLRQPRAVFIQELTMSTIHVVPKEEVDRLGDDFARKPVGTGAFIVKEWVEGQRISLVKNPDWFFPPRPYLDEVEYQIGFEPNVSLLRILRGEIDFSLDPPPATELAAVINDPKYADYRVVQPDVYSIALGINVTYPPLDRLEVRQAVHHAMNIDKYVDALGGAAVRMTGWIPRGIPGFNPELKPLAYDPAMAKDLLAKAGMPDGFKTEIYYTAGRSDYDAVYPMIQQDLKQVGIDADLKRIERKALQQSSRSAKGLPMFPYSWGPDFPDPFDWYASNFRCADVKDGGTNAVKYCNPKMDALMDSAERQYFRAEDADKRLKAYQEVEKMLLDDVAIVPLYTLNLVRLRSPRFKGHYLHPIWREDWESYWTNPR